MLCWKSKEAEKPPNPDDELEAFKAKRTESFWPHGVRFSYEDLQSITEDFSEDNFVCEAHFGKVYRGKEIRAGCRGNDVIVKTWKDREGLVFGEVQHDPPYYNIIRFTHELSFITSPSIRNHPNVADLIGYCFDEKHLCLVYDLKVPAELRNVIDRGTSSGQKVLGVLRNFIATGTLKWIDRIMIALALARTLKHLHNVEPQYLVRDLSASRILLDQDFNPILFDFAMISGGVIGKKPTALTMYFSGPFGYTDDHFIGTGRWTEKTDVYAFGIILLELICKRTVDFDRDQCYFLDDYARAAYPLPAHPLPEKKLRHRLLREKERVVSFADESFHEDKGYYAADDVTLSKLARCCIANDAEGVEWRPSMEDVVKKLLKLQVARSHGKRLGV